MGNKFDNELELKHLPQNRKSSPSKLRRGGKHCPVCLAKLTKIAKRTRQKKQCTKCGANPQPLKVCSKCRCRTIWQSPIGAACQSCGSHGQLGIAVE